MSDKDAGGMYRTQYAPEQVAFSEVDKLRAENETLRKENDKLRSIDASKESQIGALHQRNRNTVDHLNDMIRRNDELSKRNDTLQALLTEERERHAKAIADAKEMEDGLRDSIGGPGGWRESNDKIAAKISDVEAERDSFHSLLKAENAQCMRFQSNLDRERGRADAAANERDNLSGQLQGTTQRIQSLENDIERIANCMTLPPDGDVDRIIEEIEHLLDKARDSQGMALAGQLCDVKKERDELAAKLGDEESEHLNTLKDRDEVIGVADILTAYILGEDINWSDHSLKWQEAVDVVGGERTSDHLAAIETISRLSCENRELAAKVQELQSIVAVGAIADAETCMKCVNCEKVTADRDTIYRELLSLRDFKQYADSRITMLERKNKEEREFTNSYSARATEAERDLREAEKRIGTLEDLRETDCTKLLAYQDELRRQIQAAWQRLDYYTADRLATLIGDPKPSDHEREDLQPEPDAEWPEVWEREISNGGRLRVEFDSDKDICISVPADDIARLSHFGGGWWERSEIGLKQAGWKLVSKGGKAVR